VVLPRDQHARVGARHQRLHSCPVEGLAADPETLRPQCQAQFGQVAAHVPRRLRHLPGVEGVLSRIVLDWFHDRNRLEVFVVADVDPKAGR